MNGPAAILHDPGLCAQFTVNDKAALSIMRVTVREAFFHSAKHWTPPFGEALYYITAAYAQLERGILAGRVRAGMTRATL